MAAAVENLGNKELAAAAAAVVVDMGSGGPGKITRAEGNVIGGAVPIPAPAADLRAVEGILGYTFGDEALMEMALTHPSFYYLPDTGEMAAAGPTYERLEFVGDAVLNCVVARFLYSEYEELPPGPLTRLRSANVDTEKLARVAVRTGLYKHLRHKAPHMLGQIEEFRKTMSEYPLHSNGLLDPPKVLADVVEALLGAVFVDSNDIEAVWKVFERLWDPLIRLETLGKHPTSELFELCQKKGMAVRFQTAAWRETNAVEVLVDGKLAGRGTYGQKKEVAQNRAAKAALDHLKMMFAGGGGGGGPPGRPHPEEELIRLDHTVVREVMNGMPSIHTSSGDSDGDGRTAAPPNAVELQDDHMPGREVMNNMSDHTAPSDDNGKTAVLLDNYAEELRDEPIMPGRREEIMNSMTSDHTSSGDDSDDDGINNVAVLPNYTEELVHEHMLGRREEFMMNNNMPDHASSGESDVDDDRETGLLPNPAVCCC